MARKRRTNAERFWRYVRKTEECWLWTGFVYANGYGGFNFWDQDTWRTMAAHRFSYQMACGPIPSGHVRHHLCHVRHCVRPDHLVILTQPENVRAQQSWTGPAAHAVRRTGDMPSWSARRAERFWQFVQKADGCWLWTGPCTHEGYGRFSVSGRGRKVMRAMAHRYAYELTFGTIPPAMLLAHHCDNRACVRPDHLFLATPAENSADMTTKGRQARGNRNAAAKLSEADVRAAIELAAAGLSDTAIAGHFGVSNSTIGRALTGATWAHLKAPRPTSAERSAQCAANQKAGAVRGERAAKAKLTAEDIPLIRRAYDQGVLSTAALGRRYGVSDHAIYCIGKRKSWRHIPAEE